MKAKDANMRFLFGSVSFFILIMVVVLFSYFVLRFSMKESGASSGYRYAISFSEQFEGTCYDLYLNDSLLYVGNPVSTDTVIRASGKRQDNALLLVERSSDIVTVLEVEPYGELRIRIGGDGELVVADAAE